MVTFPGARSFVGSIVQKRQLAACALLLGAAAAQETPPAPSPGEPPKLARVVADQAKLRCWPSEVASPPVFEDALAKDQVVAVGRAEGGFRAVLLPLGPVGYVSKKFADEPKDGKVRCKGRNVSFRYRPKTGEAPVAQLPDGSELWVLGEQDDWWRVRGEMVEAWLPEGEIQLGDPADAALQTGFAALRTQQHAEVQARIDAIAAAAQKTAQDQADLAAVQLVADAFAKELEKPVAEQQFAPISQTLDKLEPTLAAESPARASIASLRTRIQTQSWIVEATAVRDSKPVPVAGAPTAEVPKDSLERFQSIGWLRYENRIVGLGEFYIEKGDRRQYVLSCSSGRYDLSLFVDREVGVIGPRRRPATESLAVLDVERIEVLGGRAK
jgi:hypothetical protein